MRKYLILCILLMIVNNNIIAQVSIRGYLDNRLYVSKQGNEFSEESLGDEFSFGGWNRARISTEADISEQTYVNVTVDFFNYYGYFGRLFRFLEKNEDQTGSYQSVKLDRAYLQISKNNYQIMAGMQRVSLGKSFIWSPFDVFNRINLLEPTEEKKGVNAVKFTYYPSNLSRVMFIAAPAETYETSRLGFVTDFNIKNTDFQTGIIKDYDGFRKRLIAGVNLKGEKKVGYWIEYASIREKNYINSNQDTPILEEKFQWYHNFILGIDYTFDIGNSLYLMCEYYYYSLGAEKREDYNYNLLLKGKKILMGEEYVLLSGQYRFDMFSNFSISAIRSIVDGGTVLIPNYNYDVTQNVKLVLGMNLFYAREGDEFKPPESKLSVNFFGNYHIYTWLKVNF